MVIENLLSFDLANKWDIRQTYFFCLDFKACPFKHYADSIYNYNVRLFWFFWNNKNTTNYIAFDRIPFCKNFNSNL